MDPTRRRLVCLGLALLAFGVPSPATAGSSPAGSTFGITNLPSNVRWPDVAYDSANGVYLVVTGNGFVQGQFVSAAGAMLGGPFQINATSAYAQAPRVAYSAVANAFLITWHSSVGNVAIVRGRLIRYGGGFLTGDIDISPGGSYWEMGAAVAASTSSGEFAVAWMGDYGTGNNTYYRLVSSGGVPLGVATRLTAEPDWERDPSVTYNAATNEFMVAYTGWAGSYSYVQVVRVQPGTGTVLGAAIVGTSSAIYIPEIEYNSLTGKSFVTWYSGNPRGMFGRVLGTTGSPEGDVVPVSTTYYAYDANDLAFNAVSGTYLMTTHTTNTPEDAAVEISGDGVPMGGFIATNSGGTGNFNPRVASATNAAIWLLATSRAFSTLAGQFVAGVAKGAPPPPPPPPPLSVTMTSSHAFPQPAGTVLTFTATPGGGDGSALEHLFRMYNQSTGTWTVMQNYSGNNVFQVAPAAGTTAVQVLTRKVGSQEAYEAFASSGFFTMVGPLVATIQSHTAFPQPVGQLLTFSANASGGTGAPKEYQFRMYNPWNGSWSVMQNYSPSSTFSVYPAPATTAVQVLVRHAGSQAAYESFASTGFFTIVGPLSVSMVASTTFPVPAGTPITFTAYAAGGNGGAVEYLFRMYNQNTGGWVVMQDYSSASSFRVTPAAATTAVQVLVRQVGSTAAYDNFASSGFFTVTSGTPVITSFTSDKVFPQPVGSLLTFTATASGGVTAPEYLFRMYNPWTGAWTVMQPYSSNNRFQVYPGAATTAVQVLVRNSGSSAAYESFASTGFFTITP